LTKLTSSQLPSISRFSGFEMCFKTAAVEKTGGWDLPAWTPAWIEE